MTCQGAHCLLVHRLNSYVTCSSLALYIDLTIDLCHDKPKVLLAAGICTANSVNSGGKAETLGCACTVELIMKNKN